MGDSEQSVHAPSSPQQTQTFHRDRRRGGLGRGMHATQDGSVRGAGFRGGRSERGGRGRDQLKHNKMPSSHGAIGSSSPSGQSSDAMNGAVSSAKAVLSQGKEIPEASLNGTESAVADSAEGDVCFICASTIEHTSIAPCNHQTCHICSLRLRALYKTRACAHCRVSKNT